ncbi:MAG: phosphoribosylformylglycinamidine synthase I [Anaerolineales bacterium]|nr:phosphoribosylformylglycinamidine synthase I [Anaerolineales bacterium]
MKPTALVLFAYGANRDNDIAAALELAGAAPGIVPLNHLRTQKRRFSDYQMLVLPGGFSYADALGAGRLHAIDLTSYFLDEITAFVETGKPVIGVCNGFQALVASGILPGNSRWGRQQVDAALTFNSEGHFECRWSYLRPVSRNCIWTRGLEELVYCPVAHGEGNFQVRSSGLLDELVERDQVALTYVHADGSPSRGRYPANPNGSVMDIAGVTNPQGNVLGMMPHPENHIYPYQHPLRTRGVVSGSGLPLFVNGVAYAQQL